MQVAGFSARRSVWSGRASFCPFKLRSITMADTSTGIQFAADTMQPAYVYNHDVVGLYNRLNRFVCKLIGSQSSNVSMTNSFDMDRMKSYLDSIDKYHDWILGESQLDLPETKGQQYTLNLPPVVPA